MKKRWLAFVVMLAMLAGMAGLPAGAAAAGLWTVTFHDVDGAGGLITKDGKAPCGFKAAGADGVFLPVDAVIAGETIQIDVSGITGTPQIRYAWEDKPPLDENGIYPILNLQNSAGFPMAPFRTDTGKYNYKNGDGVNYWDLANYAPVIRWIRAETGRDGRCVLTVNARDYDGQIAKLEIYKDDVLLGEAVRQTEDTFTYVWADAREGSYAFHAIATDDEGTTSVQAHSSMGASVKKPRKFTLEIAEPSPYHVTFTDLDGTPLDGHFGGANGIRAAAESEGAEAVLILAAYQGDQLIRAVRAEDGQAELTAAELTGADQVRAFLWESTEGIRPLTKPWILAP